jgi:hypothetical protein
MIECTYGTRKYLGHKNKRKLASKVLYRHFLHFFPWYFTSLQKKEYVEGNQGKVRQP